MTFEPRFEGHERVSHMALWVSNILGRGASQCNGLIMAICLMSSGRHGEGTAAETE